MHNFSTFAFNSALCNSSCWRKYLASSPLSFSMRSDQDQVFYFWTKKFKIRKYLLVHFRKMCFSRRGIFDAGECSWNERKVKWLVFRLFGFELARILAEEYSSHITSAAKWILELLWHSEAELERAWIFLSLGLSQVIKFELKVCPRAENFSGEPRELCKKLPWNLLRVILI